MRVVAQSAGPVGRFVRTMRAGLLLVLLADPAAAQTAAQATTARDLIHNLVAQRTHPPDASLTPDELAAIARRGDQLANEIGKGIAIAVATAPVGGSAAGFSYGVNPTTGELTLRTASFGPILMDRPLTNGAGVFGFGVSYQRLSFDRFLGQDLRTQGTLLFDNRVTFASDGFEQDITEDMALEPTVDWRRRPAPAKSAAHGFLRARRAEHPRRDRERRPRRLRPVDHQRPPLHPAGRHSPDEHRADLP